MGANVPTAPDAPAATLESCREYLETKTFRLRPQDYTDRYPKWSGAVGLEIEALPVRKAGAKDLHPANIALQGPGETLASYLRELAAEMRWNVIDADSHIEGEVPWVMGVSLDDGDGLSFEPGGQLEFSSRPYPCLRDAIVRTQHIQKTLDAFLARRNIEIVQLGLNPWHSPGHIGLQMPKPRYQAMNEYFTRISPFGQRMMRQTCTVQVNLDFGPDETSMAKRYLVSHLVAPIASGIFANSGIMDGQPPASNLLGLRSEAWRFIDPSRTGMPRLELLQKVGRELSKRSCVDAYMDFCNRANVVFVTRNHYGVPEKPTSWQQWLSEPIAGIKPDMNDFEVHLSLLFPEVRARGFLELRSIDCQARPWQFVPAAFYTGLLYHSASLDRALDLLMPYLSDVDDLLRASTKGLADPRLTKLAKQVMAIAQDGFNQATPCFRGDSVVRALDVYADHFVAKGRVPALDIVDAMRGAGEASKALTLETLRRVESDWWKLLA